MSPVNRRRRRDPDWDALRTYLRTRIDAVRAEVLAGAARPRIGTPSASHIAELEAVQAVMSQIKSRRRQTITRKAAR